MSQRIVQEFPIHSQTSETDKQVLLQIKDLIGSYGNYTFCEVGSFLGGSLTPFLIDPHCQHILSIDERNRQLPDERGTKFDYNGVSHQTMLDTLTSHGLDTGKITTFDGSIDNLSTPSHKFDLMFIDGEHTDIACFRDFIHGLKLMKDDAIIAFHDSDLIYRALRMIQECLRAFNAPFKFVKAKNSVMSAIFIGKYAALHLEEYFDIEENLEMFYTQSENMLLQSLFTHRLALNISYGIKEAPVIKAC